MKHNGSWRRTRQCSAALSSPTRRLWLSLWQRPSPSSSAPYGCPVAFSSTNTYQLGQNSVPLASTCDCSVSLYRPISTFSSIICTLVACVMYPLPPPPLSSNKIQLLPSDALCIYWRAASGCLILRGPANFTTQLFSTLNL